MSSAADKFSSLLPETLGYGPHSTRLMKELQLAIRHKLWASVIILSATIVDVIRYEEQIFDLSPQDEDSDDDYGGGYFEAGGYDYLTMAERRKLEWLREVRNQIIHYDGPIEGMLGRAQDDGVLRSYADKAISAILPIISQN
ncbi:MAG: hypothetical protein ACON49_00695 [Candidatus Puniceispirillaceae bacterium]